MASRHHCLIASMSSRRRVLVLHGWTQCASYFEQRCAAMVRKASKAGFQLCFIDAPHELPPDTLPGRRAHLVVSAAALGRRRREPIHA